jgi:hypothetical protein
MISGSIRRVSLLTPNYGPEGRGIQTLRIELELELGIEGVELHFEFEFDVLGVL